MHRIIKPARQLTLAQKTDGLINVFAQTIKQVNKPLQTKACQPWRESNTWNNGNNTTKNQ